MGCCEGAWTEMLAEERDAAGAAGSPRGYYAAARVAQYPRGGATPAPLPAEARSAALVLPRYRSHPDPEHTGAQQHPDHDGRVD